MAGTVTAFYADRVLGLDREHIPYNRDNYVNFIEGCIESRISPHTDPYTKEITIGLEKYQFTFCTPDKMPDHLRESFATSEQRYTDGNTDRVKNPEQFIEYYVDKELKGDWGAHDAIVSDLKRYEEYQHRIGYS